MPFVKIYILIFKFKFFIYQKFNLKLKEVTGKT